MGEHIDKSGRDSLASCVNLGSPPTHRVWTNIGQGLTIYNEIAGVRRTAGPIVDEPIADHDFMLWRNARRRQRLRATSNDQN